MAQTRFYRIYYFVADYGWQPFDDADYTEQEANKELKLLRKPHADYRFRKKFIGVHETQMPSCRRQHHG